MCCEKSFRAKEKSPPPCLFNGRCLTRGISPTSLAGLGSKTITRDLNNDFSFNFLPGVVKIVSLHSSPSRLLLLLQYYSIGLVSVSVTASVADTGGNHDSISRPAGKAGFRRPIDPFPSGRLLFGNKKSFVLHVSFIGPTSRLPVGLYRRHWWSDNGGERLSVHVVNYDFTK